MSPQINSQGPLSDLPHRVGELSLSWKRQVKSVGIFWFLSSEKRAQNKGKLGYDEGNL